MNRLIPLILLASFLGCAPDDERNQGIAVGNPGAVSMALASADDFTVTRALVPVQWVGLAACEGEDRVVWVQEDADLVQAPLQIALPAGAWCGLVVRFNGTAQVEASWDDGVSTGTLVAELTPAALSLVGADGPLTIDPEAPLALELASPGWLEPQALGLEDGADVVVTIDDPAHDALIEAIARGSALFDDLDASGRVEASERDLGPIATAGTFVFDPGGAAGYATADGGSAGCSCAVARSTTGGWALLAIALLARRRRYPS